MVRTPPVLLTTKFKQLYVMAVQQQLLQQQQHQHLQLPLLPPPQKQQQRPIFVFSKAHCGQHGPNAQELLVKFLQPLEDEMW